MASYPPQLNPGAFVPTTSLYDLSRLYEVDVKSPEFKELLVRLYQTVNNMALLLNIKDTGYYSLAELVNGQAFFQNPALNSTTPQNPVLRQVFRLVLNFGPLLIIGDNTRPHGLTITSGYSFTRIYATASDTTAKKYIPIPYVSQTENEEIQIFVDATNVHIVTAIDYSSYDKVYAIIEYIKQ